MDNKRLFIGIDIHKEEHIVSIIDTDSFANSDRPWEEAEYLAVGNNKHDYLLLDTSIRRYGVDSSKIEIGVDLAGDHYSEPLIWFLLNQGYNLCYLIPKSIKEIKEGLLNQANKDDIKDAFYCAYLLLLRDSYGIPFRLSTSWVELGSQASFLNALFLQRLQYSKLAVQCSHRMRQLLVAVFPEAEAKYPTQLLRIAGIYPTPEDILNSANLKQIKYLRLTVRKDIMSLAQDSVGIKGVRYKELILDLAKQRELAKQKCSEIEGFINSELIKHPYGKIILSFPYINCISSAVILSIVKDISRWPNKRKLKKAFGIYAVQASS